jgi:3-hydroxyacyl-[acyl-carrier-protein] dehydratase
MLLNNFYTVTETHKQDNGLQAVIRINPGHEIFKGHFPGQPVVPGVCMVQIIKEFMTQAIGIPLLFSKGNQLKFLQLLVPVAEENIQVNINWKREDAVYMTQADFKKGTDFIFKLSGIFSGKL